MIFWKNPGITYNNVIYYYFEHNGRWGKSNSNYFLTDIMNIPKYQRAPIWYVVINQMTNKLRVWL